MEKTMLPLTPLISKNLLKLLVLLLLTGFVNAQTVVSGTVVDENNSPLEGVTVSAETVEVVTNRSGKYSIKAPTDKEDIIVYFIFEGKEDFSKVIEKGSPARVSLDVRLSPTGTGVDLGEVVFQGKRNVAIGSVEISPQDIITQPTLTGSFTDILKTLPYVNSNTELSSQYMVRGGNYDENLVYLNGIEVYRPQLIRSGKQEGLNFLNPSMAAAVTFSPGGWEAKYGDKMSSSLDVIYKRPKEFSLESELSLMGANVTVGTATKDGKFSALVGGRYMNRNLILETLDGDTEFNPQSYDIQTSLTYDIGKKWKLNALGNFSRTLFEQEPHDRTTKFGTLQNPISLKVFYNGKEEDVFQTEFGALSLVFSPNNKWNLSFDTFAYHSGEEEYFDIQGAYVIEEIDSETGASTTSSDIAGQIDHARNDLDLLVAGIQHRGKYNFNPNNDLEWGVTYQQEDIRDLINEWQLIDSAGYNATPFNTQPNPGIGQPNLNDLVLNYSIQARNNLKTNRFFTYAQYSRKMLWGDTKVLFNVGARLAYWDYNGETNISPRAQIALKPNWNRDMLFRFATGWYYQPPFYKELRRLDGTLNPDIKSQESIHFILGHDYEFKMLDRPFKWSTEAYYKILNDLIPYYIDNVRIRYTAENNSKGNAYGIDTRLTGEFVPGVDSWVSLSYARVKENIDGRGDIPRPTDPRFKASLFFQDYMPILPSFKVNVTLIYASGLPNGAPMFTDPYDFQNYLPDYKRVDIGLTKTLVDQSNLKASGFFGNFKELSLGLDVFNVFNIKNTVSRQWIRDVNTNRIYGVPNRLTGRFFNAKLYMKF